MLDKKYIEAYKSIRADDAMNEKILKHADKACQEEKRASMLSRSKIAVSAIAACAALLIGLGAFSAIIGRTGQVEVLYNGQVITARAEKLKESGAKAVSFGRESVTASGIPLEIRTDSVARVSVTWGELQIFDESYDDLLFVGTNFTTEEDVLMYWNLSDVSEEEPMLIIDTENEHWEYTLEESEEYGYIIKLSVKEKVN